MIHESISEIDQLNRQLEIEAALEKVRVRANAMQRSNQLKEVIQEVFDQLKGLGLFTDMCCIDILQKKSKSINLWVATPTTDYPARVVIPHIDHPIFNEYHQARKSRKKLYTADFSRKIKNAFFDYAFQHTDLRGASKKRKEFVYNSKSYTQSTAFAKNLSIWMVNYQGQIYSKEDNDILKRFTRVFDQSYTRFLDLKKAEEQVREAQIEVSLERVRAKAMAMHSSEDLTETVGQLFKELNSLNISLLRCGVGRVHKETRLVELFTFTGTERKSGPVPVVGKVALRGHSVLNRFFEHWKEQKEYHFVLKGALLKTYHQAIKSDYKLPGKQDGLVQYGYFFPFPVGLLYTFSETMFTEEELAIFRKFSSVVGLTYRRFLDLKEAEEQAREAQIEASLERVRAKAMAMHSSEDLTETVGQLFKELNSLDISLLRCGVGRIHKDSRLAELFTFTGTKKGEPVPVVGKAILKGHPVLEGCFEHWKKQKEYHPVLKGILLKNYYQAIEADYKLPGKQDSQVQYGHFFSFRVGMLYTYTEKKFSEEELVIFRKFSSVMGLTYRRFLDLKEAEEQAREAQIEVALERVRARTMAMHKGDELADTSMLLFEQITELGIKPRGCGFLIMDEATKSMEDWSANLNEKGKASLVTGTLTFDQHPMITDVVATWRKGDPYFIGEIHGKELQKYYRAVTYQESTSKAIQDKVLSKHHSEWTNSFYFEYGMMYVLTPDPISEHEINVLMRFAGVFKLTYRRFLDLKKAEEQAREAQIEAALERVRSSAMAMHNSQDIGATTAVMFKELKSLGIKILRTGIGIIDEKHKTIELWMSKASEQNDIVQIMGKVPAKANLPFRSYLASWEKGEKVWSYLLSGDKLKQYYQSLAEYYFFPEKRKRSNKLEYMGGFFFSEGGINTVTLDPLSEEAISILQRFAGVFDLTYRRYLDLKKAEAQAREAQIEAALERVRSAAMAMHSSDDIFSVAEVLHDQLGSLGQKEFEASIIHIYPEQRPDFDVWYSYRSTGGKSVQVTNRTRIPENACSWSRKVVDLYRSDENTYLIKSSGKMLRDWYQVMADGVAPDVVEYDRKGDLKIPKVLYYHFSKFSGGALLMVSNDPPAEEARDMQRRAATVFDLAYRRFLDLQKAEAQAREAQIEAALERIRARAMAMHKSSELAETSAILFDQLLELGIQSRRCGFALVREDDSVLEIWSTGRNEKKEAVLISGFLDFDQHPLIRDLVEAWKRNERIITLELHGKELQQYYKATIRSKTFASTSEISDEMVDHILATSTSEYSHFASFDNGLIYAFAEASFAQDELEILSRFATAFELTYRRFLDLQKAESQAREAQVEAGLERVRASTMAMHSSEDVGKATMVLFQELENLGIETLRCGVSIIKKNKTMEVWAASTSSGGEVFTVPGIVDMTFHPMVNQLFEYWKSGKEVFTYELKGKDAQRYYKALENMPHYQVPKGKGLSDRHISNGFLFKEGALFAFTKDYFTKEASDIFQKFTNVFTLTYGRYLDLKQAEAREKEAVKQSSLDRVRAEIASMRTTEDLQRITPLVWRELRSLGVPFFRCGVFIMDESAEMVRMYLSKPTGESLAAVHLDFDDKELPLVQDAINHWKTQTVHRTHWDRQQFKTFTQSLKKRGLISSLKTYQQGEKPPESLNLHQVPFKQGMLYVGSSESLPDDQIELVQSLADAFSVAYARYEDFVQLEEAKESVENTLIELKSAQDQLIHSEKMASLGELTAGIAHEIQNPLNFVNNFSEVSGELLDEMKEEIESGNHGEVAELVEDLVQNLDKIAHHGKRASGIVRGMLDHSRASSDIKVATDINVLADEYLRLAYHGFRAKDKSFNANFKAVLANDLPKINIVSQDIGRVILNLVNNAFQAVREVENPEVIVKTQMNDENVVIRVIDNGPGIPADIKEKIFQPFFTTKAAGEGTGLGLSLSYDIVTKGHGGTIEVKSNKKEGTEFTILLPDGSTL